MYPAFRQICERVLRVPHDPSPPPGDHAATRIFRADEKYYRYLLFIWALKSALTLVIVGVATGGPTVTGALALNRQHKPAGLLLLFIPALAVLIAAAARLFMLAVVRLDFDKRWYVVTDRSLRVREGVVAVREMTVNFANIQNISISQGPIQRALGIADLRVETAGGGGSVQQKGQVENLHTAWFRGVSNAHEVRELIQERLRHLKDSGLGDHEEESQQLPVVSSTPLLEALRGVQAEAGALRRALTPAG